MSVFVTNFYFLSLPTRTITWSMDGFLTWKPVNSNACT